MAGPENRNDSVEQRNQESLKKLEAALRAPSTQADFATQVETTPVAQRAAGLKESKVSAADQAALAKLEAAMLAPADQSNDQPLFGGHNAGSGQEKPLYRAQHQPVQQPKHQPAPQNQATQNADRILQGTAMKELAKTGLDIRSMNGQQEYARILAELKKHPSAMQNAQQNGLRADSR